MARKSLGSGGTEGGSENCRPRFIICPKCNGAKGAWIDEHGCKRWLDCAACDAEGKKKSL